MIKNALLKKNSMHFRRMAAKSRIFAGMSWNFVDLLQIGCILSCYKGETIGWIFQEILEIS